MAYGLNYTMRFKNRISNDIYRAEIWQKDFSGASTELTGAETPLTVAYQDNDILTPIKPIELTLSLLIKNSDGISLESFYSDDDEAFRIDIYCETPSDKLLYSAYLVQDGASEPETDRKHILTLKATDNLALLKNVTWNQAADDYSGKYPLLYYIQNCLTQTGLFSHLTTIDQNLPLHIYDNLFENTTDDRTVLNTKDPFNETTLDATMFQADAGVNGTTWVDCYTLLTKILQNLNAVLLQSGGCWVIIRPEEYKYFSGAIPGTEYNYTGTTIINALTLAETAQISRNGGDLYPINEDQNKEIVRPLKQVIDTFNYNVAELVHNKDLAIPPGTIPDGTHTSGGMRYDDYLINNANFPGWEMRHGTNSYVEVVTEVATNEEKDRYISVDANTTTDGGIQFNPIEVSKGDILDFSCSYKTQTDISDVLRFWVRAVLVVASSSKYDLVNTPASGSTVNVHWNGPYSSDFWDTGLGFYQELPVSADTSQYNQFSISSFVETNGHLPLMPEDGVLLFEVRGTNASDTPRYIVDFKDINLTLKTFINNSVTITGQQHNDSFNPDIKAIQKNDLDIDDSPSNSIAGTLFTDRLYNFDYTDTNTGEQTLIGDRYFQRTHDWHIGSGSEALKLGNIIARERLQLLYTSRFTREGTFRKIHYDVGKWAGMLTLFTFDWLPGRNFLPRGLTIDYMNDSINGKLQEVYKDDESDFVDQYNFKYIYNQQ